MSVTMKSVDLGRLKITPGKKVMAQLGASFLVDSRRRIEAGIGSSGKAMRAYTPAYAKIRAKAGRVVDHRTLVFSDRMLSARGVKATTDTSVTIGWGPGEESLKALGNEARTPFVAPTSAERKALIARVKSLVKSKIAADLAAARATKK